MFERFTDRARRVMVLAQEEARIGHRQAISTEYLLLGLVHEAEGAAGQVLLTDLHLNEAELRKAIAAVQSDEELPEGTKVSSDPGSHAHSHVPFTARSKKVLELSLREALQLGHNFIGTEHILLGLVRDEGSRASQLLTEWCTHSCDLVAVRAAVIKRLSVTTDWVKRQESTASTRSLKRLKVQLLPRDPEELVLPEECQLIHMDHAPFAGDQVMFTSGLTVRVVRRIFVADNRDVDIMLLVRGVNGQE